MITAKLNLAKLKHVSMKAKGKKGEVKGLFIPIEANHLFEGKDGNVYLDLVAFELKNESEYGDTHLIKQSLPKEVREKMTDEEKNEIPILGNLKAKDGYSETPNNAAAGEEFSEDDDLPF